jgi:hypothetical protein
MSNFNWCHGPECHTKHTVDRVRGVKGSKVLRTRKVRVYSNNNDNGIVISVANDVMMTLLINISKKSWLLHQGPRLLKRLSWTQQKNVMKIVIILITIGK